jgi:hypothetical protein
VNAQRFHFTDAAQSQYDEQRPIGNRYSSVQLFGSQQFRLRGGKVLGSGIALRVVSAFQENASSHVIYHLD